jgi:hypothetical protein
MRWRPRRSTSRHPLAAVARPTNRSGAPTPPGGQSQTDGPRRLGTPHDPARPSRASGEAGAATGRTDRPGELAAPLRPATARPAGRAVRRVGQGQDRTPNAEGGSLQRAARTLGLLAATSATGWLLSTDLVSGPLTIPLTSLADLQRWLDDSTPAIVPAALLRLAALGVCAYLALALALTLVAQLVDRPTGGRAFHAVRRLLPAALQRLVTGGVQCSLAAAAAFPLTALPISGAGEEPPTPSATMVKLDDVTPTPEPVATATMTRLPTSAPPTTHGSPTTTVAPIAPTTAPTSLAPVPPPPRAPAPAIPPDTGHPDDELWTVTPGDTFWSIAEEALTDQRGSFPTQHEIVRYWRQLIATNQPRLAVPSNPDLLLPGQSLVLPPPS